MKNFEAIFLKIKISKWHFRENKNSPMEFFQYFFELLRNSKIRASGEINFYELTFLNGTFCPFYFLIFRRYFFHRENSA